ncbi:MAG: M61 family metallopeptidase [Gemmatimonadetes bacterium]|nr:M61 family metallopeptidase [Gemmatimonadota bacterium]
MSRFSAPLFVLPAALAALAAVPAAPAAAQTLAGVSAAITDVRYQLRFDAAHGVMRSVGVEMRFVVRGSGPVLLSLPAWTPGAYEISDYARNISGFSAAAAGRALRWDKFDPDTWRLVGDSGATVTVSYEARADSLDNAFNWARDEFALVNGTNVFLYPEGQPPEFPSTVTVQTEPQWRVVTGLPRETAGTFHAPSYHELVDAPFFIGRFDLDSAEIAGRWTRLATYPAGSVAGARRARLWESLRRSVPPQVAVFGETPWTTYTVMQIADSSFGGMSALEHQNSNVGVVGTPYLDESFVPSVYAHEIFHAFNVKRLRPVDMWPYRYDTAQPTTWLWVSEGITDYYADAVMVRGGAITPAEFLALTQGKMDHVAQLAPVALEDASLQTWLRMRDGTQDIYYDKGSLAGLALDILIRDASDNSASLDDVMRALYTDRYKQGRGFSGVDWWAAVTRAAGGASFADFNARYVDGRDPMPWNEWLPKAGWRYAVDTIVEPRLGVLLAPDSSGQLVSSVNEHGAAYQAGVRVGDVLLRVNGVAASDPDFLAAWRTRAGTRAGAPLTIEVRRDGRALTLKGSVQVVTMINARLEDDPAATRKAVRIRTGILTGRR